MTGNNAQHLLLTLLLSLVLILALCLLLYAAVALIQNRKLFTTAPKDIQAAAKDHPERIYFSAAFPALHRDALSLESLRHHLPGLAAFDKIAFLPALLPGNGRLRGLPAVWF